MAAVTRRRRLVMFDTDRESGRVIEAIARRAVLMAHKAGIDYDFQSACMDITATHCSGCPLRLGELLSADDFNFGHDVLGIYRHLNRDTGKLERFFRPRFSARIAK